VQGSQVYNSQTKRELLAAELIFETVKGQRPNRASWYAVTWRILDKLPGYDLGVEKAFKRGAYRNVTPIKNASLRPPRGTDKASIAPPHGTETPLAVPPHGPIRPVCAPLSVPSGGNPLEVTKGGVRVGGSPVAKLTTCQHAGCRTLTLKNEFCAKHRHLANAHTAAPRRIDTRGTQ